jgi:hypothetical protein
MNATKPNTIKVNIVDNDRSQYAATLLQRFLNLIEPDFANEIGSKIGQENHLWQRIDELGDKFNTAYDKYVEGSVSKPEFNKVAKQTMQGWHTTVDIAKGVVEPEPDPFAQEEQHYETEDLGVPSFEHGPPPGYFDDAPPPPEPDDLGEPPQRYQKRQSIMDAGPEDWSDTPWPV